MIILKPQEYSGTWMQAIICEMLVIAKVFDEPSHYGYKGGRVSKVEICKAKWDPAKKTHCIAKCLFSYDRGDYTTEIPEWFVDRIISQLEKLPKKGIHEEEARFWLGK